LFKVSDGLRNFLDTTGTACGGDYVGESPLLPAPHSPNLNATLTAAVSGLAPMADTNVTDSCLEVTEVF
jgi:hypothetical protein